MILESIRITADALADATIGVNAQLDSLSRDPGDPEPTHIVKVKDVTRDEDAAKETMGLDWPILVVTADLPAQAEGEVGTIYRDAASVPVRILYVTGDADAAQAVREGLYVTRAIVKTIRELMRNENRSMATRNGIVVMATNSVTWGQLIQELPEGMITAQVVADYQVRDTQP
jgi:hypothetical protein